MCFSATASFAAAGVTTIAGGAALSGAQRRVHVLLGAIPLMFAVHQFAEGVVWLALSNAEYAGWERPATFTFLTVAEVVWPVWVPLSILALEADPPRRTVLSALLTLGVLVALTQAYGLAAYAVTARIAGQHIQYGIDSPWAFRWATDIAYGVVTVLPPLVSSTKLIRWLGVLVLASLVLSKLFFYETFISVWCFFAALISALLVLVVRTTAARS